MDVSFLVFLEAIKIPQKPIGEYKEGDYVFATYGNSRKQYGARISEISREYFGIFSPRSSRAYFGFPRANLALINVY